VLFLSLHHRTLVVGNDIFNEVVIAWK